MGSLIDTLFLFLLTRALIDTLSIIIYCFHDSLVIVILVLTLSTTGGEENTNFLPLRPVAVVEGVSTRMGARKGETSLYGD
jgi:hypothetical protein